MSPAHDVAIYMPYAGGYYDRTRRRTGGAERQTVLLAQSLVAQGLSVAHIVYRMADPDHPAEGPTLVVRPPERRKPLGRAIDPLLIWRAMQDADAGAYVFRGASGVLGPAAMFCRARGRRLVFSGANNADFAASPMGMEGTRAALYQRGVARADRIVVQSHEQIALADARFPGVPAVEIPSFAEPGPGTVRPAARFLWIGRTVEDKRPEAYVALARALPEAQFTMVATISEGLTAEEDLAALHAAAAELPNLHVLGPQRHAILMDLVAEAVAIVNTSTTEGMPNVWLEGWARGVPALSLAFDPDGRVARHGLGVAAADDWDAFVAGARRLWEGRADRAGFSETVRRYVTDTHGVAAVGERWADVLRGI